MAIGVQLFTEAMEKDSYVGAQEMHADFLEEQMESPVHGYESAVSFTVGGKIAMFWDEDVGSGSFIEWGMQQLQKGVVLDGAP